jgi:hypothetical protein
LVRRPLNEHIVPAPDVDRRAWGSYWNENWQGKPSTRRKLHQSQFSTTYQTRPDKGSNSGRRDGNLTSDFFSYGTITEKSKVHYRGHKSASSKQNEKILFI